MSIRSSLQLMLGLALVSSLPAGTDEPEDKTLAPYFSVQSKDPGIDQLPLLSTSAEVNIAGVIADVAVTQVYKNSGKRPLEAIYVFPASTRAAVYALRMTIGDRVIVADIRERQQARKEYQAAKNAGRTASLLEQERPNVFQMNVANIMPGDRIEVEMRYTELLVPTAGVYEFVYPTVVGPRYSTKKAKGAEDSDLWLASPYQHSGEKPLYDFDIRVSLNAGLAVRDVSCPSHKTDVRWLGERSARVTLAKGAKDGGNRDFIFRYRLSGGKVETGLLLYQAGSGIGSLLKGRNRPDEDRVRDDENFFLLMVQPPKRVTVDAIPPREYIFIVDVSGSMHGYPLEISKKLLRDLVAGLRPSDKFNVLLFAGGSTVMSDYSLAATEKNIRRALEVIDRQQGGGGTELLPALNRALDLPRAKGMSRTVVIVTDGYVAIEAEAFDVIRKNLGRANMFAFGIGTSVNRHLIEGIAHVGMGEAFVVTRQEQAESQADKFREYIGAPVLTDIDVDFGGFETYDPEPLSLPDVLAERPVVVFGKWRGSPTGVIRVSGRNAEGRYDQNLRVSDYAPSADNSALRYLWARHRVQILADYNDLSPDDTRVKEVTRLGLKYSLLTQYTSFVAVDTRIRNKTGKTVTVEQPLPLPEGVSDHALGDAMTGLGGSGAGMAGGLACAEAQTAAPAPTSPRMEKKSVPAVRPAVSPNVRLGKLMARGAMTDKTVLAELEKLVTDVKNLYVAELAGQPGRKGTLRVKFVIQPDGSVAQVKIVSGSISRTFDRELLKLVQGLRYANLAGGLVTAEVQLIFEY